jgi:hypothetical protein
MQEISCIYDHIIDLILTSYNRSTFGSYRGDYGAGTVNSVLIVMRNNSILCIKRHRLYDRLWISQLPDGMKSLR